MEAYLRPTLVLISLLFGCVPSGADDDPNLPDGLIPDGSTPLGPAELVDEDESGLGRDLLVYRQEVTKQELLEVFPRASVLGLNGDVALVPLNDARHYLNALSDDESLLRCYGPVEGAIGKLLPVANCDGWRIANEQEFDALVGSHDVRSDPSLSQACPAIVERLSFCLDCTCFNGPRRPPVSEPNNFGLHDLIGNQSEWVEILGVTTADINVGAFIGGSWEDVAQEAVYWDAERTSPNDRHAVRPVRSLR